MKNKYEISLKRFQLAQTQVALAYDETMMGHLSLDDPRHPEQPLRIKSIYEKMQEFGLLDRVSQVGFFFKLC